MLFYIQSKGEHRNSSNAHLFSERESSCVGNLSPHDQHYLHIVSQFEEEGPRAPALEAETAGIEYVSGAWQNIWQLHSLLTGSAVCT